MIGCLNHDLEHRFLLDVDEVHSDSFFEVVIFNRELETEWLLCKAWTRRALLFDQEQCFPNFWFNVFSVWALKHTLLSVMETVSKVAEICYWYHGCDNAQKLVDKTWKGCPGFCTMYAIALEVRCMGFSFMLFSEMLAIFNASVKRITRTSAFTTCILNESHILPIGTSIATIQWHMAVPLPSFIIDSLCS